MSHLLHVGDKDAVTYDEPIVDGCIGVWDYVDPLMLSVVTKTDFDDATIRCIAIGNGENPVVEQL